MLVDDAATAWLDGSATERDLLSLLNSYDADDLEMYDVGRQVNNTANDSPECIARVRERITAENAENAEQFVFGELLAPVRPRTPR